MRKQIAAANWKMNCNLPEAESLLKGMATDAVELKSGHEVIVAVPYPYLLLAAADLKNLKGYYVSAQNCYNREKGAYTGEVSAGMIASCGVTHVIIGHSERRGYFKETNEVLAAKIQQAFAHKLKVIFCCGETLDIREAGTQNAFIAHQIRESLFHWSAEELSNVIIAYEPIWAIGTGKTATAAQAQEMHLFIRKELSTKYGDEVAQEISILYGGSVKSNNAEDLFGKADVDGGLVGGASLKADEFKKIIRSLKKTE